MLSTQDLLSLSTKRFISLSALSLIGLWVSDLLVLKHIDASLLLSVDRGLCDALRFFSCEAAVRSDFSVLLGVPIASLGEAWYLTGSVLLLAARISRESRAALLAFFSLGVVLSALYSLFLGVVSIWLGSLCPYCALLYLINLLMLLLLLTRPGGLGLGALRGMKTRLLLALSFLSIVSLSASLSAYTIRRDHRSAQEERQRAQERRLEHYAVEVGAGPARGAEEAPIEIVEFSDFQCPYCRRLAENIERLAQARPGLFRLYFRHFPLDQACNDYLPRPMHPAACLAAKAVVCAEAEGRSWALHDMIFARQRGLNEEVIAELVEELALDQEQFQRCLEAPETLARVKADITAGVRLGISGTPAFFINGWRVKGALSTPALEQLIEEYGERAPPSAESPSAEPPSAESPSAGSPSAGETPAQED